MDEYTLVSATQIPHIAKVTLSGTCGIPESKLRVIAPDVGGGFGSKLNVYAEEALALALTKKLGRPVKWIEERSENYVATIHGRGVTHDCTIAGTEDGKILGLKFVEIADMGAYYQLLTPGHPRAGRLGVHGARTTRRPTGTSSAACSRTARPPTPTAAPAGRRRPTCSSGSSTRSRGSVGKDPAEVRRMNLHPPFDEATTSIWG